MLAGLLVWEQGLFQGGFPGFLIHLKSWGIHPESTRGTVFFGGKNRPRRGWPTMVARESIRIPA